MSVLVLGLDIASRTGWCRFDGESFETTLGRLSHFICRGLAWIRPTAAGVRDAGSSGNNPSWRSIEPIFSGALTKHSHAYYI